MNLKLTTKLLTASLASAAALAAGAGAAAAADTYCVAKPSCEAAGGIHADSFDGALKAAQGVFGSDIVEVGAGTFHTAGGLVHGSSNAVDVIGSGRGATTVVNDGEPLHLLSGSSLAKLTLDGGAAPVALELEGGDVDDVTVKAPAGDGLIVDGGAVRNSTVTAAHDAVSNPNGFRALIQHDDLRAGAAAVALNGVRDETPITQSRLHGNVGVSAVCSDVSIQDTLAVVDGDVPIGVFASTGTGCIAEPHTAIVRQSTIVGSGADSRGLFASGGLGSSATLIANDTIVSGFAHSLARSTALGSATVYTSFSAYDPSANVDGGGSGSLSQHDRVDAEPEFVNPAKGRYALRHDSALIDAGETDPLFPVELDADLRGLKRVVDGDGDATERRDLGAVEYQRSAPAAEAKASATRIGVGRRVAFSATAVDFDPGDVLGLAWSFGDGATATGAKPTHAYAKPGTYGWTATATDPTGLQVKKTGTVVVVPRPRVTLASPLVERPLGRSVFVRAKQSRPFKLTATARLKVRGVQRKIALATPSFRAAKLGGTRVSFALTRKARRALRRHGRGVAIVRVTGRDGVGQVVRAERRIKVRAA